MFLRDYVFLDHPMSECQVQLMEGPDSWLPYLVQEVDQQASSLLADVGASLGPLRLRKRVDLDLGKPVEMGNRVWMPISWKANGAFRIFPSLNGDLTIEPMGPSRTKLALAALYEPPLGSIGGALDRALLHTVAEATIRDLLRAIGDRIDQGIRERRNDGASARSAPPA